MKLAALVSGGKDSMLALHKAAEEHEIVCLVGVIPENPDSFMFHTPNLHLLDAIASSLELPIYKVPTAGEKEKEVDELINALRHLKIDGIVIGGIESEYQRKRFQRVADELGIEMIAPLWHVDPEEIMKEVVEKFDAIFVRVAAMGLDESWLGRKIDEKALEDLKKLNERYEIHLAGEGGEFETLVLDAPLYKRRIVIEDAKKVWQGSTGILEVTKFRLEQK
jgi:predicted ATP pyrophosphatase (TIGR00289 family)